MLGTAPYMELALLEVFCFNLTYLFGSLLPMICVVLFDLRRVVSSAIQVPSGRKALVSFVSPAPSPDVRLWPPREVFL